MEGDIIEEKDPSNLSFDDILNSINSCIYIQKRGYLKEGYKADITVIDLDHMKVDESKPDFKPEGIVHVYVNGQPVLENGEYCGGKAGVVVLKK